METMRETRTFLGRRRNAALLSTLLLTYGCGGEAGAPASSSAAKAPAGVSAAMAAGAEAVTATATPTSAPVVVFLGDSLTAGYGLSEPDAFPALIAEQLERAGRSARVVNAGVSGDTTAGGLSRLDWLLQQKPAVVLVALGANDGLRGVPVAETERNLRRIVERVKAAGAEVVLAGMMLPPNYGPEYTRDFQALFPKLAREQGVPLVPFLLEGVAAEPNLNLADGIHPNVEGQKIVATTVYPFVTAALARAQG
jgi:acyl-CoA thioesterase I